MTIKLALHDGRVFVEALPGVLSYLATRIAWEALSDTGKLELVYATYQRLGLDWPPKETPS